MKSLILIVTLIWLLLGAAASQAQPYALSDLQFLPGDQNAQTAVRIQNNARIAAGDMGYLVVWEDQRTVQQGYLTWPTYPLMGNLKDIYAARLDVNGNLLDPSPIIISNAGLNQSKPDVAWNGQNWLVVWETMRSDWYFFTDILAVRVSPQGAVLDSIPINIRLENQNPSGDHGSNPSVTSDGTNWVVTWEDISYVGSLAYPNIVAARISPSGTIIDNPPIVLYTGETPGTFGPVGPQMRLAGDEFLVVWGNSGLYTVMGKRYDLNLQSIDRNPFGIANTSYGPRLASNGTDFFVVTHDRLGYRVTHSGTVLDPNGIEFGFGGQTDRGPDVAWDGANWVVGYSGVNSFTWKIYLTRISTSGTVLPPGYTQVGFGADDQFNAALASLGGGYVITAWDQRSASLTWAENIHSVRVADNWSLTADQDVSLGWHRQSYARAATNGNEHMVVFQSQGGGLNRVLAQRLDASGNPLDLEPVVLTTMSEGYTGISSTAPEITFNGSVFLAVWTFNGTIYGSRLLADCTLIDPVPVAILTNSATSAAVAAVGDTFYIAYTYVYSGNQQSIKGVRLDGSNLSVIDSPVSIGINGYNLNPVVRSFGNRWLVVWEQQVSHDQIASTIHARFVETDGTLEADLAISTSGDADVPDVAIAGSRALIVWHEYTSQDGRVRAILMDQDGTFPGGQFLVSDANNRQWFATCAWDGEQFVVAWTDYRSLGGVVEQLRGDIYASRVSFEGAVIDPDGIQITSGSVPEELPAAAAAGGKTLIAFSKLHGAVNPESQRIGYRLLENSSITSLNVTLTPANPPIIVSFNGGSFDFNIQIDNNNPSPITIDIWTMVTLPNGSEYGPIINFQDFNAPGAWSANRDRTQAVPASAPTGMYTYDAYVGVYPDTVYDEDHFDFEKLSTGDGAIVSDWSNWGEEFGDFSASSETRIPSEFALNPPYPNPFNQRVALDFALPAAAPVKLAVYDVMGREVAILVDGFKTAGTHEVIFNASNLSSGIYIAHLKTGSRTSQQKLIYLK